MTLWKARSYILFLLLYIIFIPQSTSSHIIGGEVSFDFREFQNNNALASYDFELVLYIDPTGVAVPDFVNIGVYQRDNAGRWIPYEVISNVARSPVIDIPLVPDPCRTRDLTNERVRSVSYNFSADLDNVGRDYLVAYQACCRNPTINNIVDTGIGAVYDVLLSSETILLGNSSPEFKGIPPIFICSGFDFEYDHSAIDEEGDELRYSFCTSNFPGYDDGSMPAPTCCGCVTPDPQICTPPFLDVVYQSPFSAENPMGGSPQITIDDGSGFISGGPDVTGAYIVSVCVEEFRNGVLLSKTRRDFEFNVVTCDEKIVASLEQSDFLTQTSDQNYIYEACHETSVAIINASIERGFIENYTWVFSDENMEVINISGSNLRDVMLDFPSPGIYTGYMKVDDGAECEDSVDILVNIIPPLDLQVNMVYDTCVAGPVSISYLSSSDIASLDWAVEMGDGNSYSELITEHIYDQVGAYELEFFTVDEYGCENRIRRPLDWFPLQAQAPDTIMVDTLICYEDSLLIQNEWVNETGIYLDYVESIFSGCDSIVKVIQVEVTTFNETTDYVEICMGYQVDFYGSIISEAGTYRDTLVSSVGCDSVSILELVVFPLDTIELYERICESESYTFGPDELRIGGVYSLVLNDRNGCDSLILLDLEILQEDTVELIEIICEGGSVTVAGQEVFDPGVYQFDLQNEAGCDSLIFLDLSLLMQSEVELVDTICLGEVYPFGALDLRYSGVYYDTLENVNGCDSLVVLDLKVGENLSRINADEEVELDYGTVLYLEPVIQGGDLLTTDWYLVDRHLSEGLTVSFVVERDDWLFFESTNDLYCVALDSLFIRSIVDREVYIPNIFTPDEDGINDVFNLGASSTVVQSQLSIYDRWGNHIYKGEFSDDTSIRSGWDGTYNGDRVEDGTYVYKFIVEFVDGFQKIYSGSVNVLR